MPLLVRIPLLAAGSLLVGVYLWFGVVWLISNIAKAAETRALDPVLLLLAPHLGGWLFAALLGVILFVVALRLTRKRKT